MAASGKEKENSLTEWWREKDGKGNKQYHKMDKQNASACQIQGGQSHHALLSLKC